MKHLGDITKINGAEIPAVDVITGGSPCQDLSVAGKRAGLDGERSGLFMEQIRIVKEMREHDRRTTGRADVNLRPRFMVWENVPGAFSSNGGKDFQAVLTEIVRIVEPYADDVPMPAKRWPKAGCLYDELGGWSIAWRVHDAQFWGVPQRRKRIALVADFGGMCAPEILFERKGLSGDTAKSREEGEGTPGSVAESTGTAISFQERAGKPGGGKGILIQNEHVGALSTLNNQSVFCLDGNGHRESHYGNGFKESETMYTLNTVERHGVAIGFNRERCGAVASVECMPTLQAAAGESGNNKPMVLMDQGGQQMGVSEGVTGALMAQEHGHQPIVFDPRSQDGVHRIYDSIAPSLNTAQGGQRQTCVCYQDVVGTVDCGISKGVGNQLANQDMFVANGTSVRRLTPLEHERLQGFPDGWTDIGEWTDSNGKKHKDADSPRYKALGNSIALPFWFWLLRRISAQYERPATLGSLFDGIGGFPLCWERCNGKGTAIWASEIEEFPIAVTKKHFPEEEE